YRLCLRRGERHHCYGTGKETEYDNAPSSANRRDGTSGDRDSGNSASSGRSAAITPARATTTGLDERWQRAGSGSEPTTNGSAAARYSPGASSFSCRPRTDAAYESVQQYASRLHGAKRVAAGSSKSGID